MHACFMPCGMYSGQPGSSVLLAVLVREAGGGLIADDCDATHYNRSSPLLLPVLSHGIRQEDDDDIYYY